MKLTLVFVLALCAIFAYAQSPQEFKVDYRISGPNLNGWLTGELSYSNAQQSVLFKQDDGFLDMSVYSNDVTKRFKYFECSGKCEALPVASNEPFPVFWKTANDNCASTKTGDCFVCNRNDATIVKNICVDDNDNVVQVTLDDDRVVRFTSAKRGGVSAATFALTQFTDCKVTCFAELDIVLVIDESGSIDGNYIPSLGVNQGEWALQRDFAVEFIKSFEIAPKKVHMGLVQFSKGSRKVIPYPHIVSDQAQYTQIIDGLTKVLCSSDPRRWNTDRACRGATYTGHALIDAIEILKDTSGSRALRANAGKVIVMVTDGNSYYGGSPDLRTRFTYAGRTWNNPTDWVNHAKNSGVTIISVGVGNNIDFAELNSYSSTDPADPSKKLVFAASTFDYLKSAELIEALGRTVCTSVGNPEQCGGNACKGSCQCGECKCPSTCDIQNMCLNGQCTATISRGGGCFFTNVDCNDNNACTADSCNPATGCANTPITCDDGDPCTVDTCNPALGCVHTPVDCSTGNFCRLSQCSGGTCTPETPNPICEDNNACTNAVSGPGGVTFEARTDCDKGDLCKVYGCDPVTGCTEVQKDCDDSNFCSTDVCVGGTCTYTPLDCDDSDMCTDDTCDPDSGCVNTLFNATERCDDGDICTLDYCTTAGGCQNVPVVCNKTIDDPCIEAICDPLLGCIDVPKVCELAAGSNTTCDFALCVEGVCVQNQTEICQYADLIAAAVAATTVIVIIIIVAAVLCLGATAGGAYAAWSIVGPGDFDNKSGIYEAQTQTHKNPLAT